VGYPDHVVDRSVNETKKEKGELGKENFFLGENLPNPKNVI